VSICRRGETAIRLKYSIFGVPGTSERHNTKAMIFADIELSRRVENAEGRAGAAYTEARAKLQPEVGALWRDMAGAIALFDGPASPVTQTFGLGLRGLVSGDDLNQLERFFFERGAPVHHEISPMADESLWPLLTARGYTPIEFTSLLYRDLIAKPPEMHVIPGIEVRPVREQDKETFVRINLEGWSHVPGLADLLSDLMRVVSMTAGLRCLLAYLDGEPVAAGAINIQNSTALFAGACTIPGARGRGAQRALLAERLRVAKESGCEIAVMGAQSGSGSQRNAERAGFQIAYTRTKWQLNLPSC
jgi:hypothetical protein